MNAPAPDEAARAKALDKIQKCLRLSKSSNPHEAAAALRQAQKLMQAYNISEDDLHDAKYIGEYVDVPIQVGKGPTKLPVILMAICALVVKAFAVEMVQGTRIGVTDRSWRIYYFGREANVKLACFSHRVIWREVNKAWARQVEEHPVLRLDRHAKSSFFMAWCAEVRNKVSAIAPDTEERRRTEKAMRDRFGSALGEADNSRDRIPVSHGAAALGAAAASDFSIHTPMDGKAARPSSALRLEHKP